MKLQERSACALALECWDVTHRTLWWACWKALLLKIEADAEVDVDDLPVLSWTVCAE